jgi:hypothetical protein
MPEYEPVALSKRAGEDALRALIPSLTEKGVEFVVGGFEFCAAIEPGGLFGVELVEPIKGRERASATIATTGRERRQGA